ncbi:WYL domain-containing protein [Filifactor alocis]|uniref:helix-turn-helix transcriptional regulator n=1 Tax=Filifactor alocis TaxID=143361 RepID=UPI0028EB44EE|nr:WYL domain-containing protein [Filifactor alocis]
MAKGRNQKLKLLYLTKIFMEKTDESHALTLAEITSLLNGYEVTADRKTLYLDFEELKHYGLDIISEQRSKTVVYYLASRDFELAELKLLVDSVQSSKFITEKKSNSLIKKLESLVSEHESKQLHRQVITSGRVKTMNESILINVDSIHSAINNNRQISFQYFQWTPDKQRELRHDGQRYTISPWHLVWNNENYYMIGYDSDSEMIKHFRVDKMLRISSGNEKREGLKKMKEFNIATYSRTLFGMLGGESTRVTLQCHNSMAGVIIDRFGKDTVMLRHDDEHFIAYVEVVPSDQFLGWIIGLSSYVQIMEPSSVVKQIKDLLSKQMELYR